MFKPGDRTLAIWINNGRYYFYTYTTKTENTYNNLATNINYDPTYLTSWTYIYFGYSRPL